jgi:hypothetical protein
VSKSHGSDSPPGVVAPGTPGLGPILAAVMTILASSPNHEVVLVEEQLFSVEERAALAGFLAGYAGLTRDAYPLDLRHTRRGGSGTACLSSPRAGADIECIAAEGTAS